MRSSRTRHAVRATHAAAIAAGVAIALTLNGRLGPAIAVIAVAVALIIAALLWALKQEDRRGA
ncbi:hypothetical protein M9978_02495 [Sphingomonas sp. MG17]|uniref:Uncharacterized protein n=1 Tax=Sphingomonas tagetis TaxID=2949092 RepID=A0A9X2HDT7_9SPHN|nr:hypothetical protein [Sphingomonas tagetis]MCP3729286.1 hypothetical protein [Sphingomonas tagetis]